MSSGSTSANTIDGIDFKVNQDEVTLENFEVCEDDEQDDASLKTVRSQVQSEAPISSKTKKAKKLSIDVYERGS